MYRSRSSSGEKRPTLREIARLAGVSPSTVSFVLSGKGGEQRISTEVEARVREIARERDYSPNLLVRSMQRGQTQTFSFFNGFDQRERGDLYQDRLFSAVERAAGLAGYDILLHCRHHRRRGTHEDTYASLNGGRTDGLLFFGPSRKDPLLKRLRSSRIPTVILNHRDEENVLSSVCDDMTDGMRQIAEALVERGHRRVAAVSGQPGIYPDAEERIAALAENLAERGVALGPIARVYDQNPRTPDEVMAELLDGPEPPTALFCWHDHVGYTVLEACERLGVRIPQDLTLIGYDNIRWPSTSGHTLASVDVDMETMAQQAIDLLTRLAEGDETPPVNLTYPVSLAAGTTLGPAARSRKESPILPGVSNDGGSHA